MPTIIQTRLAGIPCQIAVSNFKRVKGSYSYNAPSDLDYTGYTEYDYEVLDRRGRPAPWLEKKVTEDEICDVIAEYFENELED